MSETAPADGYGRKIRKGYQQNINEAAEDLKRPALADGLPVPGIDSDVTDDGRERLSPVTLCDGPCPYGLDRLSYLRVGAHASGGRAVI